MQRLIKFRAWDKTSSTMWEWDSKKTAQDFDLVDALVDDSMVVMQYTGLKDKNGREIYEGDILEIKNDCDLETTKHEVVWGGEHFYPAFHLKPDLGSESNDFSELFQADFYNFKVIGNIYENGDLLNAKD